MDWCDNLEVSLQITRDFMLLQILRHYPPMKLQNNFIVKFFGCKFFFIPFREDQGPVWLSLFGILRAAVIVRSRNLLGDPGLVLSPGIFWAVCLNKLKA